MTINNNLPTDKDLKDETLKFINEFESDFENPELITEERLQKITVSVLSVITPLYYIYTWIVSKSLFTELDDTQRRVDIQGGNIGAGYRRPHAKLVAVGVLTAQPRNHQHFQSPSPQSGNVPWYVDGGGNQQALPTIYVQEPQSNSRF